MTKLGVTVDVLVNNAGFSTMGRVSEADPDTEMQMVEVDVVAVVDLCTRFIHGMVERGRGAILNVASTAAFQPLPAKGRMVVIPGVANRVAAAMAQVTPRSLLLPVLRTHPGLK